MNTELLKRPARHPEASDIRIWDLPTRLFHVAFASCVIGSLITVKAGNSWMDWHVRFGIATLALLIFRIFWGLIGPHYARFYQFIRYPHLVLRELITRKKSSYRHAGHHPLGGWAVVGMLLIIGTQAVTGLFANDDILTQGPFAQFVSESTQATLTGIHQWNQKLVFGIIGLHLFTILLYTVMGKRLITPMIHGDVAAKELAPGTPEARDDLRIRLRAALLAAILSAGAWWLIKLAESAGSSFN